MFALHQIVLTAGKGSALARRSSAASLWVVRIPLLVRTAIGRGA